MPRIEKRTTFVDRRTLGATLGFLIGLTAIGTMGYRLLEGYSWLDSLYMTVITLSTVGYREIGPLGPPGKMFTIGLIVVGIGLVLAIIGLWAGLVIDGTIQRYFQRRRTARMIGKMKGHVIVCGHGSFGSRVVAELVARGTSVVVVDLEDEGAGDVPGPSSVPWVTGDATRDDVLIAAGVREARAVVSTMTPEATNLAITLATRDLNPAAVILARSDDETDARRLMRAGATRTISAYAVAGHQMAMAALHPRLIEAGELVSLTGELRLSIAEVEVSPGSFFDGSTVSQADVSGKAGVSLIGVLSADGRLDLHPSSARKVAAGESLVVIGEPDAIEVLAREMAGEPTR